MTDNLETQTTESTTTSEKKPRGFAAMDAKKRSEISRSGGKAAHAAGRAHQFDSEEARAAGRKGGKASHARRVTSTPAAPEPEQA